MVVNVTHKVTKNKVGWLPLFFAAGTMVELQEPMPRNFY